MDAVRDANVMPQRLFPDTPLPDTSFFCLMGWRLIITPLSSEMLNADWIPNLLNNDDEWDSLCLHLKYGICLWSYLYGMKTSKIFVCLWSKKKTLIFISILN